MERSLGRRMFDLIIRVGRHSSAPLAFYFVL